jgi:uncharacterized protein
MIKKASKKHLNKAYKKSSKKSDAAKHTNTVHTTKKIAKKVHKVHIKTHASNASMIKNKKSHNINQVNLKKKNKIRRKITKNSLNKKSTKHIKTRIVNIKKPIQAKKIIIVHGWDGNINKGWFPWLKDSLENQGFKVIMKQMPNSNKPQIGEWIEALRNISGRIDENTYFIGHSIGCQAIIRMLEKYEPKEPKRIADNTKTGGAVFLAGWFDLKEQTYKENLERENATREIAKPWTTQDIDFVKVQSRFNPGKITAIFSDNDPYVDVNNAEIFKQKLGARIIVESSKGHFEEENISEIPSLIEEILRISRKEEDN